MTQVRQIGRILSDKPVQELLERLATELPEEHKSVALSEAACKPVEDWCFGHIVELLLQDRGPDPCSNEDHNNGEKCDACASLDVNLLIVEEGCNDERAEDSGKVGEEAGKRAGANGEVCREPGAHKAVVKVADEEGRKQ